MEESRIKGSINHSISSTYIALIPKKKKSLTFTDFRPISLCNTLYKIISKLIADRMRHSLSSHLTLEQHDFLKGRNIINAVTIAQECLHSMHIRKSEAALLKIDLKKAYHCIDWGFLKCLLYKIGLNENCTNWIMACVVDVNYAVLVNGIPSSYFTAARGLRQGCSLSPLLFILVMDTPSLHIQKAMKEKRCNPLKLCRGISVSHNLFVDDILLSAMLCRDSWICLHVILGKFQKATGLCINVDKSSFHLEDVNMEIGAFLTNLFNIKVSPLCVGLKYLGYKLEPVGYSSADWLWILDRYYKRIAGWEFKCLSLAG